MSSERGACPRGICAALTGLALLISAGTATGEAAEALERGRELFVSFDYDAAVEVLESVVTDRTATAEQRLEALELMGVLHFNLNRRPRARQVFERLLNLDPEHELTDTSYPPRLIRFYTSIREAFMPQISLDVTAEARQDSAGRGPLLIEVTVSGATGGVAQAVALIRGPGQESFRRALMSRDGDVFTAEIPLELGENTLEYYVEVSAPSGHVLGAAGSADRPMEASAEVVPELPSESDDSVVPDDGTDSLRPRRRWYASWWFWTIIGVAVAGGAAATVYFTLPDEQQEGTLGTRSLP